MPAKKRVAKKPAAKKPTPTASTKPVWQKLFIKPGGVMMMNPPKGYTKWLKGSKAAAMPMDLHDLQAYDDKKIENIWLFVDDVASLEFNAPDIVERSDASTNVIVSYKKGSKELHRDTLWKAMKPFGFEGVSLIAVDETWSAMRFKRV